MDIFNGLLAITYWDLHHLLIRVTGIFNSEEILGHFLSYTTPLLIALLAFVFGVNKKQIIYYVTILIFAEVMIFISGDKLFF